MIQRIQTIWLLLAGAASFASLKFSFYSGNQADRLFKELNGSSHFFLLILTVAVAMSALTSIFLFKNRKLQSLIAIVGLVLQLGVLAVYYNKVQAFVEGNYSLTAVISLIIPIFFVLAILGIRKDEKLIKSMDRLR